MGTINVEQGEKGKEIFWRNNGWKFSNIFNGKYQSEYPSSMKSN